MTNSAYPYSYSVDPSAGAYYQQSAPINNGSVSPDDYSPSYPSSALPSRDMTGAIRTRRSPGAIGMDEPTQPRHYAIPSSTSRKEVPTYFTRRHQPPSVISDEEDELTEEPPAANATDQEKIEYKRRQNTLAARRSRKRKMQYTQNLQETVEKLMIEKEVWKTRALTLKQLLQSHGVACPDFPE